MFSSLSPLVAIKRSLQSEQRSQLSHTEPAGSTPRQVTSYADRTKDQTKLSVSCRHRSRLLQSRERLPSQASRLSGQEFSARPYDPCRRTISPAWILPSTTQLWCQILLEVS